VHDEQSLVCIRAVNHRLCSVSVMKKQCRKDTMKLCEPASWAFMPHSAVAITNRLYTETLVTGGERWNIHTFGEHVLLADFSFVTTVSFSEPCYRVTISTRPSISVFKYYKRCLFGFCETRYVHRALYTLQYSRFSLACSSYFEKIRVDLWDHLAVCMSVTPPPHMNL
jgi:hypothetical protein